MKIWKEFKEFAFKGNVIDMTVGVMIGSAFNGIVTSIVNDLFTPLISFFSNSIDFAMFGIKLGSGDNTAVLAVGNFIQTVINFFMVSICVFTFVKFINKLKRKPAPTAKPARKCPYCFSEIDERATRCPHCTSILEEQ